MDLESGKKQFLTYIKKYQYLLIVFVAGLLIMLFPENKTDHADAVITETAAEVDMEEKLAEILSQISGVGKVDVLLTEAYGSETVFQTDVSQSASNSDTVILTDSSRAQSGLVKQIIPPTYKGAVVVCKGADSAVVRLAVVDAVMRATGLSSDCVTVLKMK
jgi:stage III sporulation protein AG